MWKNTSVLVVPPGGHSGATSTQQNKHFLSKSLAPAASKSFIKAFFSCQNNKKNYTKRADRKDFYTFEGRSGKTREDNQNLTEADVSCTHTAGAHLVNVNISGFLLAVDFVFVCLLLEAEGFFSVCRCCIKASFLFNICFLLNPKESQLKTFSLFSHLRGEHGDVVKLSTAPLFHRHRQEESAAVFGEHRFLVLEDTQKQMVKIPHT